MFNYEGCSKSKVPYFLSSFLGSTEINYQEENVQEVCTTTLKKIEDPMCDSHPA